ncbi:hypothetical protein SRHO_G00156510 [Serrasalmus rhombeus]
MPPKSKQDRGAVERRELEQAMGQSSSEDQATAAAQDSMQSEAAARPATSTEGIIAELASMVKVLVQSQVARDERMSQVEARHEQRWRSVQHQFQGHVESSIPASSERGSEVASSRPVSPQRMLPMGDFKEPKLHPLTEGDDVEQFLATFERIATACRWSRENWAIRLVPLLTGKARSAYVAMDISYTNDYKKSARCSKIPKHGRWNIPLIGQPQDYITHNPPRLRSFDLHQAAAMLEQTGCELYAFCGALFGMCSMITLMVIAVDRYFVITRPLASIGKMSHKRALIILVIAWLYTMCWSLPPFFGWSAYVPEGLLTSCTWDYMTFTPSVRAYTMLLFVFVFFIPLFVIMYCYFCIFRAIRNTTSAVGKISAEGGTTKDSIKKFHRMKSEWKMAKVALIVILLYVISWSPYSCVALTAFAGYADMLTPYMNSVPAVIAKASAIHNPIIYAITHPKYRDRFTSSSFMSTRRSTITSQSSEIRHTSKTRLSSVSDSESGLTDTEADLSSATSRSASRQVSYDIRKELTDYRQSSSLKVKAKGQNSGGFDRNCSQSPLEPGLNRTTCAYISTVADKDDISMTDVSQSNHLSPTPHVISEQAEHKNLSALIPSIVVTSESSQALKSDGASGHPSKCLPGASTVASVTMEPFGLDNRKISHPDSITNTAVPLDRS